MRSGLMQRWMIGGLRAILVMSVLAVVLPSVPHEPASLVHQEHLQIKLRGGSKTAKSAGTKRPLTSHKRPKDEIILQGETRKKVNNVSAPSHNCGNGASVEKGNSDCASAHAEELSDGGTGMASMLLRDFKETLLKGEIPTYSTPPPPTLRQTAPKQGPGSVHRIPQLLGWSKNPGGEYGIELPEGGFAGGGLMAEPLRMEWARRLGNASDTAAHLGHKLLRMCDNVSAGIDPLTEKGPFYLDVAAAVECIEMGADVNGRGPFDLTPLQMLCAADGHEAIIARLLQAGGDVHAQDTLGNTPLHDAVRCRGIHDKRSLATVKLLLNGGPALMWNETALDFAHVSLARHAWWSGVGSAEAARAREIVELLGGNVNYGVEQVAVKRAKMQRRIQREEEREEARVQQAAAHLSALPRASIEFAPVD